MHDPHEKQHGKGSGYSRRQFLKGSGVAVAATAITGQVEGAVEESTATAHLYPAKANKITLKVNGKSHTVNVEPRETLVDVLRDHLNLTGCKEACDTNTCGSCTVIIDGNAIYSCSRLAVECEGQEIRTVESLQSSEKNDPLIDGFIKHDALQCGFCTSGFVMATKAFLEKNPKASLEQIQKGLGGNICRCGTYAGITKCALELASKGRA